MQAMVNLQWLLSLFLNKNLFLGLKITKEQKDIDRHISLSNQQSINQQTDEAMVVASNNEINFKSQDDMIERKVVVRLLISVIQL